MSGGSKAWSSREWDGLAETIRRELVSFDHRRDASYISTPLTYPSGASVVVRAAGGPDRFLVSDFGMGYREADMMGASPLFAHHARSVAKGAGVGYDEHAFFVLEIDREHLSGAVVAIANCSHSAVAITALKLSNKTRSDSAQRLHDRLLEIFPACSVSRDDEIMGASHTKWHFSNVVRLYGRIAIFEPVALHHASVAAAVTKFHDVAILETAPARAAVVNNKRAFGTLLSVMSNAANVIEFSTRRDEYLEIAEAA